MRRKLSQTRNAIRHRNLRARRKAKLLALLGGKCQHCGGTTGLEVNHKHPRNWKSADVWANQRLRRYLQEAEQGLVNLLCGYCNKRFGSPEDDNF